MEKVIYNFLDEYCGDEIDVYVFSKSNRVEIYSKKGRTMILWFTHNLDKTKITIWRGPKLTKLISVWFGINEDDASRYIKFWFGKRNSIQKVSDLLKFAY